MHATLPAGLVLLLSLAATLVATGGTPAGPEVLFTGRVLDDATRSALPGARVLVDGTAFGTLSDAAGVFRLAVPRSALESRGRLVARHAGYRSAQAAFRVSGDTVRSDFRLERAARAQEEVVTAEAGGADASASRVRMHHAAPTAALFHDPLPSSHPLPGWNTEDYDRIRENAFVAPAQHPLSTFSIDVDRASYSNIRRFLRAGALPPRDAVRIEEMVNYFPYSYPTPRGEHPFAVTTEVGPAPWHPEHRLLRVGLASEAIGTESLPASNLVFLIDVSGSMQSPDKLPLVKRSLRLLVGELRARDRVAIVVYAGAAGLVLPPTPGSRQDAILDAIEGLEAGGSTAGGEGLRLAYRVARESYVADGNNRVVLATDGDFNVGLSSDAEMVRLVEEERRQGTFLTVLGFGTGNLKDAKMQSLADQGNGNYAYIDSLAEARKVLVGEMGATLLTVARDVKLQVEFNPARVRAYRLIGYENRLLAAADFDDDREDAGELGAGHAVTALYEIVPVGAASGVEVRGTGLLRYQQPPARSASAGTDELAFVRIRYQRPDAERSRLLEHPVADRVAEPSADFRFAAAVAGFGMLLRDSEHRGSLTAATVVALARGARGNDPGGHRAEFISMVEAYGDLAEENRGAR